MAKGNKIKLRVKANTSIVHERESERRKKRIKGAG